MNFILIFFLISPILVPILLCLYDKYVTIPELRRRGLLAKQISRYPFE